LPEAEALLAAKAANEKVVKTTEEKDGWYYWTWKKNPEKEGTGRRIVKIVPANIPETQ
jgi:hypothetical protein